MAEIKSVEYLLSLELVIPKYQRPYKWTIQNIEDLLNDITTATREADRYHKDYKYRIGTIILHENESGEFEIVDGQQRIISLVLLNMFLRNNFSCKLLESNFDNKITQANIHTNYMFIKEWFSLKSDDVQKAFIKAMEDTLEIVIIKVNKLEEAFQLFDSQNTRGKELDPHDLLKAYHLREMKDYPYEMEHAVTKWEAKNTEEIRDLFDLYLFPIWNWSRGLKTRPFTAKEIDTYKGVSEASTYTFARRATKASPYFQIAEPFTAGNDFFEMVSHYLDVLKDVQTEMNSSKFKDLHEVLQRKDGSAGFGYAINLFYCVLICYYDKFHNFDERAVRKLFTWAFMIRVDMENLGFDSINNYAIGTQKDGYTNSVAMFSKISFARTHNEVANIQIKAKRVDDRSRADKWNWLYKEIKRINGLEEAANE